MKPSNTKEVIQNSINRYPLELTKFKSTNYQPQPHFRNRLNWDHFTVHIPLWNEVLNHFFQNSKSLDFLELGSGNGLCANYLLDSFSCYLDTVDMEELRIVEEDGKKYEISTIKNLQPFIDQERCTFHLMNTKTFLINNQDKKYDFIYIDASHDKDWVLFDAVNSFSLLKTNGLMIFDDYGWGECGVGIDSFLSSYQNNIEIFHKGYQVMIIKRDELK